ncbi:MAG: hypothetical protein DCC67_08385 [Planctomycetota bacterium]|nr:MAG: hypothetical protein DCC67_08385 [Planctomycetota bacterium]
MLPEIASAAMPADQIMSAATRGFVSIGDFRRLEQQWNQTQMGLLVKDEAMQPFIKDLRGQIERKLSDTRQKLGLTLEDLRDVSAGEVGIGLVEQQNNARAALAVTVDVTGKPQEARQLLAKIDAELAKRRATRSSVDANGVPLTMYNIPPQSKDDVARVAVFFLHNDVLAAADSRGEAEAMLGRLNGAASNALAGVAGYQMTMQRCAAEAGDLPPDARWFVDPFGYARAVQSLLTTAQREKRGKDYVSILKSQGFDAIQGMGGYVNLAVNGSFDLVHRTSVYAPPVEGAKQKYELAMQMMQLPNVTQLEPQPSIPAKLASYRTFNMDLQNAFKHFGTLFDAIAGYEHAFRDVIEGLENDPFGPQIKVEADFVQHLGTRVTLVTDYELPITTKSERYLVMAEVKNEQAIAATLKKFMEADPNARPREINGLQAWEILPPEEAVPELEIGLEPAPAKSDDGNGPAHGLGPNAMSTSAVCVTNGHLYIASHLEYLEQVLTEKAPAGQLASSSDYKQIDAALEQLIAGPIAVKTFRRSQEAYRPTYELLRQGKMPQAETLLGRVLNRLLTTPEDEEEGIVRQQKIDARSLPAYEQVQHYFNPAGLAVRSVDDGWFITGATLSKRPAPQARAGAAPSDQAPRLR